MAFKLKMAERWFTLATLKLAQIPAEKLVESEEGDKPHHSESRKGHLAIAHDEGGEGKFVPTSAFAADLIPGNMAKDDGSSSQTGHARSHQGYHGEGVCL